MKTPPTRKWVGSMFNLCFKLKSKEATSILQNKIPSRSFGSSKCLWWISFGKVIATADHYFIFRLWGLKWDQVGIGGKWSQLGSDAYIYFN